MGETAQADGSPDSISKEMIRGHVNAIVLNVLSQGDSYGYEITKTVQAMSAGQYELNEATLYTVFRRLEKQGDITSYWGDESQGGRRKYYTVTDQGRQALADAQDSWRFAQRIINRLVTGPVNGDQPPAPGTAADKADKTLDNITTVNSDTKDTDHE